MAQLQLQGIHIIIYKLKPRNMVTPSSIWSCCKLTGRIVEIEKDDVFQDCYDLHNAIAVVYDTVKENLVDQLKLFTFYAKVRALN